VETAFDQILSNRITDSKVHLIIPLESSTPLEDRPSTTPIAFDGNPNATTDVLIQVVDVLGVPVEKPRYYSAHFRRNEYLLSPQSNKIADQYGSLRRHSGPDPHVDDIARTILSQYAKPDGYRTKSART
jgi:hypothetical protein